LTRIGIPVALLVFRVFAERRPFDRVGTRGILSG
jgi:hypothetical protein